jgi:hypothetical protein
MLGFAAINTNLHSLLCSFQIQRQQAGKDFLSGRRLSPAWNCSEDTAMDFYETPDRA